MTLAVKGTQTTNKNTCNLTYKTIKKILERVYEHDMVFNQF